MKTIVAITLGLLLGLGAITLFALEGSEVAVLRSALATAQPHETRVWIVDFGGTPWVESANPEREFYRDILLDPDVEVSRNGERFEYRAAPLPGSTGHDLIRSMLREKYGWADDWIGLLTDTSSSIAIRLEPRTSSSRNPP
jgi:hypothetical protein